MARIAGVDLPRDKRIVIGLTYIFGIGNSTAEKIIAETGVSPDVRVRDLTPDDEDKIRAAVDTYKVEGDLRREVSMNIKNLQEIGSYRGMRHRRGLPVVANTRRTTPVLVRVRLSLLPVRRNNLKRR